MQGSPFETTDLLKALVEHSADAVMLLSAEGTILYASQSSLRLTGYAPDERIGRSVFEHLHADDAAAARAMLAACAQHPGTPATAEFRIRRKDGAWATLEVTAVSRLQEPSVGAVVANYRDVTARRAAEDALHASEERLRHIVEHAQDLIYYCDVSGGFTYVNPSAERVMGYEERDLIGRHFTTLVREDYRVRADELYARQMLERMATTYFEFPAVKKSGGVVWVGQHVQLVLESGRIVAIHAIARDITQQKDIEERLRRSEAQYRSLIQEAAYGIYRSTVDGRILDANPALARMLGYDSVAEVLTHNMADLYRSPADRAALIARGGRKAPGFEDVQSAEVPWKRKDGTPILVRLSARIVEGSEPGVTTYETIAEDVTERRELEEQLRQAQKMDAVGRLARGIAHDFNNLLAAIMGYSELVAERLPLGEPIHGEVMEIVKAAERGASLTRQLLTFSRSQAFEPKTVDLHTIVGEHAAMLGSMVGDRVTLRIDTRGPAPVVRIDPGQLEQVLLNLLVNARDASPQGSTVDLTSDQVALGEADTARYALPAGRYARIAIRDQGTGISPSAQPHVFEPFFTTKDPAKGTGLGLSIVYGIAKDAGGAVVFSTMPGAGTTFEFLLPLVA